MPRSRMLRSRSPSNGRRLRGWTWTFRPICWPPAARCAATMTWSSTISPAARTRGALFEPAGIGALRRRCGPVAGRYRPDRLLRHARRQSGGGQDAGCDRGCSHPCRRGRRGNARPPVRAGACWRQRSGDDLRRALSPQRGMEVPRCRPGLQWRLVAAGALVRHRRGRRATRRATATTRAAPPPPRARSI